MTAIYVSAAMLEVLKQLEAVGPSCVQDYQSWMASGEQRAPVLPVVVGQLLSGALVTFTGKGPMGDSRYGLTDAARAVLSDLAKDG